MKKQIRSLLSIVLSILLATPTLAGPDSLQDHTYELSTATSTPATIYQPGSYEAGIDIPAGEYVMLSMENTEASSYEIYENRGSENPAVLVDHSKFDYNVILTLREGYTLTFTNCTASPLSEVPQIDHRLGQGYKVGFQIPAGTYRLKVTAHWYAVYYIDPSPSGDTIPRTMSDYAFLSGDSYVTVEDGDYLLLVGCILQEYLGSSEPPADHTPLPDGYDTANAYQPGIYRVGIDIPAGDYNLFTKPDRTQGQFSQYQIQTLEEHLKQGNEVIDVYLTDYVDDTPIKIHLEDGNVLKMSNYLAFRDIP